MEVFLYILENKEKRHYVGITGLWPEDRLKRHNHGDVSSTKAGKPWKIICIEIFPSFAAARSKEKLIKSWKGGNAFKNFLSKAAGSSNGRTAAFGAAYPGSNPGPAALERDKD